MLWKGFQKPKRLDFDTETLSSTYGRFHAQPFERGFGTTIGNAIRRILLSSIGGGAETAPRDERGHAELYPTPQAGVRTDAVLPDLEPLPNKRDADQPALIRNKPH